MPLPSSRQIEKVEAEIEAHHNKIAEYKQMIEDKQSGRDAVSAEARSLASKIAQLGNDFDRILVRPALASTCFGCCVDRCSPSCPAGPEARPSEAAGEHPQDPGRV